MDDQDRIHDLPIAEKIRLVEVLWDDISRSEEPFPWTDYQVSAARRRAAELEEAPSIALTRDELWERVDSSDD